jgi:hypothetical protein
MADAMTGATNQAEEVDDFYARHMAALTTDSATLQDGEARETIARIIIGPRQMVPRGEGRPTLRMLQDIRWQWSSEQERKEALWTADAILAALAEGA